MEDLFRSNMKKILLLLTLNFSILLGADFINQPLLELLEITGVQHNGTPKSILEETQKKWLRPSGKERWQIPDIDEHLKKQIVPLADQLGFVGEICPQATDYEHAAILGATFQRMGKRLDYLVRLWNQRIRFKEIVFLTGQRPLDPSIEPVFEGCKNESEAARHVWSTHLIPDEMRMIPVTFIDVPMKEDGRRPTIRDTYPAWLETQPKPGRILLISNQPYCRYQDVLAKALFSKNFQIETVGPSIGEKTSGADLLDSITQWIFYTEASEL